MIAAATQKAAIAVSIADLAQARLRASSYPSLRRILCVYDEGMLVLRGRLPTFFQKQLAQVAVADIQGVGQIVNQIEVLERASYARFLFPQEQEDSDARLISQETGKHCDRGRITVTVLDCGGTRGRLGITAPGEFKVVRHELVTDQASELFSKTDSAA